MPFRVLIIGGTGQVGGRTEQQAEKFSARITGEFLHHIKKGFLTPKKNKLVQHKKGPRGIHLRYAQKYAYPTFRYVVMALHSDALPIRFWKASLNAMFLKTPGLWHPVSTHPKLAHYERNRRANHWFRVGVRLRTRRSHVRVMPGAP